MAFGVYAATNVTVGITGQVQFTAAAHVNATVTIWSAKDNFSSTKLKTIGTEGDPVTIYDTDSSDLANETNNGATFSLIAGDSVVLADDLTPSKIGTKMVYTYTVTINNKAKASDTYPDLKVKVTASGVTAAAEKTYERDGYSLKISEAISEKSVAAQGTLSYTITLEIDSTRTMAVQDIGTSIALEAYKA